MDTLIFILIYKIVYIHVPDTIFYRFLLRRVWVNMKVILFELYHDVSHIIVNIYLTAG